MYQSIFVPLDGSVFAEAALPVALSLSRRTGAGIRLLNVVEFFPTSALYGWEDVAHDHAQEYLEETAREISGQGGGEVVTAVRVGDVADILHAEAENSDLVVMASHGRGGLARAWLGSVADSIVRHAKQPVVLVRPTEDGTRSWKGDWTVSKMLLPMDGSSVSEAILQHAVDLGSLFGATYHLMRAVPAPMQFSSPYPPHMIEANHAQIEEEVAGATTYLHHHADSLRGRGLTVEEQVVTGVQPAHGILTEAERSGCDFIAISAHGRGPLARAVLGSTSDKVVRGTHLPLLLFRAIE
jgi:nucleotide-binding universal stress UspA family protein